MSQTTKFHKIQVRNRYPDQPGAMTGARTEVLIDGVPFKGITFFKFEAKAAKVNKVLIEMFADVELDLDGPVVEIKKASADAEFELGQFHQSKVKKPE